MNNRLTISLDAMGGDSAPAVVVKGINIALTKVPEVDYLLFGDETLLNPLLDKYPAVRAACQVIHTDEAVTNEDGPAVALRRRRNSSMRLAINAVGDGRAAGIVSAGNTGALMAMAKFVLKTLPGISRPAIAAYFPTERGQSVMLDLGANIECDANNLVQFAVMGEVFARNVFNIEQPSVGILNVGSEEMKGNSSVKEAAAILQESHLPIKFYGFVEGDDISKGTVDVIVTDGFTGNIALKTAEGMAKMVGLFLKEALMGSFMGRLGAFIAAPALRQVKMRLDPRRYNGAMFLGLNGICVKSHGGTDSLGFSNAILVAVEMVKDGLNEAIKEDYAQLAIDIENAPGPSESPETKSGA